MFYLFYHPLLYANTVKSLKKKYREKCTQLSLSGSGLTWEELVSTPEQQNLAGVLLFILRMGMKILKAYFLAKIQSEFPFFSRLHGFWRSIPSFNPHIVSSHHGQDLQGEAQELLFSRTE
jgi:hypothetical protein